MTGIADQGCLPRLNKALADYDFILGLFYAVNFDVRLYFDLKVLGNLEYAYCRCTTACLTFVAVGVP